MIKISPIDKIFEVSMLLGNCMIILLFIENFIIGIETFQVGLGWICF